jgi:hypothetical protein
LACPICEKRPPRRFCPAKGETICAVCCGTEREVTIDCPSDCSYLHASRQYDLERREVDPSKVPFADTKIPASFVRDHQELLLALSYALCAAARDNRLVTDADVLASLAALAETYKTLTSGIYYEKAPDFRVQRELYDALKLAIEEFKKRLARQAGAPSVRDSEVRDALVFMTQLGATRSNGRPKGRAFLDFMRSQFKPEEFSKPASSIVLLP